MATLPWGVSRSAFQDPDISAAPAAVARARRSTMDIANGHLCMPEWKPAGPILFPMRRKYGAIIRPTRSHVLRPGALLPGSPYGSPRLSAHERSVRHSRDGGRLRPVPPARASARSSPRAPGAGWRSRPASAPWRRWCARLPGRRRVRRRPRRSLLVRAFWRPGFDGPGPMPAAPPTWGEAPSRGGRTALPTGCAPSSASPRRASRCSLPSPSGR